MPPFALREVKAKSVLTKSRLPGADYVINPYVGCAHACAYCYAVFMKRVTRHDEQWGAFVDVKVNAAEVLERQLARAKPGTVLLSSVTDPYHPLEKKYVLTRRILEVFCDRPFEVSVLTKSDLVVRDTDVLLRLSNVEAGFSFSGIEESDQRVFEPLASSPRERFAAMKHLWQEGIPTYAFFGPVLPGITDLEALFIKAKRSGAAYAFCENLNHRAGTFDAMMRIVREKYPHLEEEWRRIFSDPRAYHDYWGRVEKEIAALSKEHDLTVRMAFHHG